MPVFIKALIITVIGVLISVISYLANHEDFETDAYQ